MGTISVVRMGFAAVLLGLAVDYAVVHYQEALAHPQMTVPEIRRAIAPSILWAAITTMSAFLVLNLGGLPGLGQLGSLVAIGIALSAWVMVMIYLPPLFPERRKPRPNQPHFHWWNYFVAPQQPVMAEMTRSAGGSPASFNTSDKPRPTLRAIIDRVNPARCRRGVVFPATRPGPDRQRPATAARRGADHAGRNHVGTRAAAAAALGHHFREG